MTFSEIQKDLYRRLGYDATPATAVTTRLNAFINESHHDLMSMPGMERMRDDTISVASVASREYIALPQAVDRIIAVTDRTNSLSLRSISKRRVREINPNQLTGTPHAFAVLGTRGVAVQPSNASDIFVDSTSASDTNTAYLEGVRTGGYRDTTSVTMTGVTAIGFDTPDHTDWTQIDKFYVDTAAVGTVTLHEDASGGTELARIPIGATYARYLHMLLEPVPSAVVTYHIDYVRQIEEMSIANDEPLLPRDFHRMLVTGARMKEYERREDMNRYKLAQIEFLEGVRKLKYWLASSGVQELVNRRAEHSNLEPGFPAS
jgi:hypothetical protein